MKQPRQLIDKHYEIILDSIADGVFTVDLGMRITSFNRAAEKTPTIHSYNIMRANQA